jgi:Flp pilus assembly protein TadB
VSASAERELTRAPEGREPVATREGAPTGVPVGGPPPAGEEIHLPGPTLIPFVCAIGITLIVVGTTINWLFSALGVVIVAITVWRWIRDTRRDMTELPEEHR